MEFLGRIDQLSASLDAEMAAFGYLGGLVLLVTATALSLLGKRKALLLCLVLCMPFAGFVITSVDAAATLCRWLLVFALAASCMRGVRSPGASNLLLGVFGLINISMLPYSEYPAVSVQFTVLWIAMTWLVGAALADDLRTVDDLHAVIKILLVGAGLYILLSASQLPSFRGGIRFSGASKAAPVFVITGGLLLPIAVWASLCLKQMSWRVFAMVVAALLTVLILFSGQRTGTYAGILACIPVVWRVAIRNAPILLGIIVGIGLATVTIVMLFPDQAAFAFSRYASLDVTGRDVRWQQGWRICLEEPLIAHGIKPHIDFHNAALEAWYRGGLQGLVFIACGLLALGWQSIQLSWQRNRRDLAEIGRLSLGILVFVLASSIPEDKLISPSNMTIFMTVLFGVIVTRGNALLRQDRITRVEPAPRHGG